MVLLNLTSMNARSEKWIRRWPRSAAAGFLLAGSLCAQGTLLRYRFPSGETLFYRIDRQDSTAFQGQTGIVFRSAVDRVKVEESRPDGSGFITVTTDTAWSSGPSASLLAPADLYFESGFSGEKYLISATARPLQKNADIPPFFIPLSEKPVSEGSDWDFQIKSKYTRPYSGRKTAKGHCQFYGFVKENNVSLAVLTVRIETELIKKWSQEEPFRTISHTLEENRFSEGAAYLNADTGCVIRMVYASRSRSSLKVDGTASSRTVTSWVTIRLLDK